MSSGPLGQQLLGGAPSNSSGSILISSATGGVGSKPFMSPWLDFTTPAVPDSHDMVMWWAQYLWVSDGNFRTAMERVAAHFITTIEFPDLEPDEESAWKDLFLTHLNYRLELQGCAHDYLVYGNAWVTIYLPFKRFARCGQCAFEQPISEIGYRLKFTQMDPYLIWGREQRCPRCGDGSPYDVFDRRDPDLSRVRINRYDSADIELAYNRFSQRKDVRWRIPDDVRADVQTAARIHIDDTPLEVLQAVAVNGRLRFDEDMILHQAEPTISGMRSRGWGIPRSISNFRTAWLQQLTNKMDQATAIDYTMGMRLMSPTPTPGGQDPMVTHSMEQFVSRMNQIVNNHRANPTGFYTVPYPVNYQFIGAEGANMLPPDKLKFRQQEYLNQLGVPLEYHQMSLSTQAAPMALRLFEAYWQSIPALYNKTLDWTVKLLARVYGLDPTTVRMQKTTIADDMERKNVLLQLMSANQLSPQTALQPFGIDAHTEIKKVYQNQAFVAKVQQEFDEREAQRQEMGALKGMAANPSPSSLAAQQQQGAQGGGGGAPAGAPMGGVPTGGLPGSAAQNATSLSQMSDQAQQIAQQIAPLDEYTRGQQLRALRESNKDLHALVMSNLDQIRSAAASQGKQMVLQQGQPPAQ